jgi:hypothetical protein
MTRLALRLTAALVAAVFLWLAATLPPRAAVASGTVPNAIRSKTIAGAFHVHSTRSDGAGDRDAIATAAARAGLQFVVITDHGDATRAPEPPAYVHGVLCVDAVEISTNGGHVIALDMSAAPYPLGGEAEAVVEDILRLGGMPIAAHPDSGKLELAWKDWDTPLAGLEWLNLDSAWRDESRTRLTRVAFDSVIRPGPALASLLDRPAVLLARWDALGASRRVVGMAGHDAHGGISGRSEEGSRRTLPGLGSYQSSFLAFSSRVILAETLTGDAGRDARALLDAVRAGRVFTAIDGQAAPAAIDFHATADGVDVAMGEEHAFAAASRLSFRSMLPRDASSVLLRDGVDIMSSGSGSLEFQPTVPGVYRVEVRQGQAQVPWIVTNPIYLRGASDRPVQQSSLPDAGLPVLGLNEPGVIEKDRDSTGDLVASTGSRTLGFHLRAGERVSQYVALAVPLSPGVPRFDRIAFTGKSEAPMRLSVQLRFEQAGGARWVRSVYLSPDSQEIVVPTDRLLAAERPGAMPPAETASSVLFVVDLTNARPGAEGQFEISNLRLAVPR